MACRLREAPRSNQSGAGPLQTLRRRAKGPLHRLAGAQSGMTLIEVMIAVTLFAFLSLGILTALRVGVNAMDRSNERLMTNRRAAYAIRILEAQLTGFMPEPAVFRLTPQSQLQLMPFFEGEPANMRFVSTYSLQDASRGMPQILEFTVIPGAEGRGVRLVVNEHPYTGPASAGVFSLGYAVDPVSHVRTPLFRPIETGPGSFVLADKLAYCRFLFEGARIGPLAPGWFDHWVRNEWPIAVRIEMAPLDPDPSRLQPMTVTTAVHVNKNLGVEYADN
jgi:prepilin-type N-terminal cleavage/methylation domain-containing protein